MRFEFEKKTEYHDQRRDGKAGYNKRNDRVGMAGKYTPDRTGIAYLGDMEESFDDDDLLIKADVGFDNEFRNLVGNDNGAEYKKVSLFTFQDQNSSPRLPVRSGGKFQGNDSPTYLLHTNSSTSDICCPVIFLR